MRLICILLGLVLVGGVFAPAACAADPPCEASHLTLGPPGISATYSGILTYPTLERGVFFKALKDFNLCSVGVQVDTTDSLEVNVYAATGTTRGPLLARRTIFMNSSFGDGAFWYVPVNVTLLQCHDYEVFVRRKQFTGTLMDMRYDRWNPQNFKFPFEVGGVVRVRGLDAPNSDQNFAYLLRFELIGNVIGGVTTTDVAPASAPAGSASASGEKGIYVRALTNTAINSVGFYADVPAGNVLEMRIWDGTGLVRGSLITLGRIVVASSGLQWHDIPVNAQLVMGHFYEFSLQGRSPVSMNVTSWPYWTASSVLTFNAGPLRVMQSSSNLGVSDPADRVYHFRIQSSTPGCGFPFTLAPGAGPPPVPVPSGFGQYGAFVRSLLPQEIYSIGVHAGVPDGTPVIVRVFDATGGQRGALLAEGSVNAVTNFPAPVPLWIDVPLSIDLEPGMEYDISVECPNFFQAFAWDDHQGFPFVAQGTTEVETAEMLGDPLFGLLIEMHMYAWNAPAVGVRNAPARTPLYMAAPVPSPVSRASRVDFTLDASGPLTVTVYDVAGRRVSTLLDHVDRPAGPGSFQIDASKMPSGVYFVRLQTRLASVSRRIVVVR